MPGVSLSDATLKAVQAYDEERHRQRGSQLSLTAIRHDGPNHLGMALQRHRRAGQLENRDQRWYLPPSA